MYVHYSCQNIAIDLLELHSSWDIHPFLEYDKPILQTSSSIKRLGLIHLPLVLEHSGGHFEIVTGMRAISSLTRFHKIAAVQCRVLPADTSPEVVLSCIYEEYSNDKNELSAIEIAHFHALCIAKLANNQHETFYLENNIAAKPHLIRRALDLLKLELPLQTELYKGTLAENSARDMLRLKAEDRIACFELFQALQLGSGKQRRLLSLLRDLAGREGLRLADYISSSVIQDIVHHLEMNTPQKAHSLLQRLQQLHTPSLVEAENRFERWKAQLQLAENCNVTHSTSFEQNQVALTITFSNRDALESALPTINKTLQKEHE